MKCMDQSDPYSGPPLYLPCYIYSSILKLSSSKQRQNCAPESRHVPTRCGNAKTKLRHTENPTSRGRNKHQQQRVDDDGDNVLAAVQNPKFFQIISTLMLFQSSLYISYNQSIYNFLCNILSTFFFGSSLYTPYLFQHIWHWRATKNKTEQVVIVPWRESRPFSSPHLPIYVQLGDMASSLICLSVICESIPRALLFIIIMQQYTHMNMNAYVHSFLAAHHLF